MTDPYSTPTQKPVVAPAPAPAPATYTQAPKPQIAPAPVITAPTAAPVQTVSQPHKAGVKETSVYGYDAATSTASQGTATLRDVQDNELVSKQLASIISDDSPLLQRARQRAMSGMNRRGLINSSMALGAADAALYDAALPIATSDAAHYGATALENQRFTNSMEQVNVAERGLTGRENAGLISTARSARATAENQASQQDSREYNQAERDFITNKLDADKFDAGAHNVAAREATRMDFDAAVANGGNTLQTNIAEFNAEIGERNTATNVGGAVVTQFQASVTNIMNNPELDQETKEAMIDQLIVLTRNGLEFAGLVPEEIDRILDMGNVNARIEKRRNPPAAEDPAAPVGPTGPVWNRWGEDENDSSSPG